MPRRSHPSRTPCSAARHTPCFVSPSSTRAGDSTRRGLAAEGREHFVDASELDAGAALGAPALGLDRVELEPVGVGKEARLALANERFGGGCFGVRRLEHGA